MSTAVKDEIQQYWDQSANTYDKQFGHGISNQDEKKIWLAVLKKNIQHAPGAKVLDVGTGTGFLAFLLSEMGYQVTGIDNSEKMLSIAKKKHQNTGLPISFQTGDAENPCFEKESFDVIICRHLVWTLPNLKQAIQNWKSLLNENGLLVIIDGKWKSKTLEGRLRQSIADVISLIKRFKSHSSWIKEYVSDRKKLPFIGGTDPDHLSQLLSSQGFMEVWKDDLSDVISYEKQNAPFSYRILCTKHHRHLIGGIKKGE